MALNTLNNVLNGQRWDKGLLASGLLALVLAWGGNKLLPRAPVEEPAPGRPGVEEPVAGKPVPCVDFVAPHGKMPGLGAPLRATCTIPSRPADPSAQPRGTPARIRAQDDAVTTRSLIRENESAQILARAGYDVEQRPPALPNGKQPDYIIEGQVFDNYAPSGSNPRNIASKIQQKVDSGQTSRNALNLDDSAVPLNDLRQQLKDYPVAGLQEIIVVKNGQVIPFFP